MKSTRKCACGLDWINSLVDPKIVIMQNHLWRLMTLLRICMWEHADFYISPFENRRFGSNLIQDQDLELMQSNCWQLLTGIPRNKQNNNMDNSPVSIERGFRLKLLVLFGLFTIEKQAGSARVNFDTHFQNFNLLWHRW